MHQKEVADTIIELLGGKQFVARVGRRNLIPFECLEPETPWPGLQIHLLPGSKMELVTIALPFSGLYVVRFRDAVDQYTVDIRHIRATSLRNVFETLTTAWKGEAK